MVRCKDCKKGMRNKNTKSCKPDMIMILNEKTNETKWYKRDTEYFDNNERCHDCNIVNKKGNIHHLGCDMERCPKCKGQLISCRCNKMILGRSDLKTDRKDGIALVGCFIR